jgi:hypothetical protein
MIMIAASSQDPTNFFIIVGIILFIFVAVIVLAAFGYLQAKKRREALKSFAQGGGFTYQEYFDPTAVAQTDTLELTNTKDVKFYPSSSQSNPPITQSAPPKNVAFSIFGMKFFSFNQLDKIPWLNFSLFNQGSSQQIDNFMKKSDSQGEIYVFDYSYTIHHSGKNSSDTTYTQTVILTKQTKTVPSFELFPEGLFGKIADIVGFKDIDFDSNKEFSDKYRLKAKDEAGVRQAFTSPLLNYLVTNRAFEKIESNAQYFLFYTPSRLVKVEELAAKIDSATKITQMLSQY